MTLARPTRTALITRAKADYDARMPGADSRLRPSNLDVQAKVHAAAVDGLYGSIAAEARFFPSPDNPVANARWASLKGIVRTGATASTGEITVTCTDDAEIPAGAVLTRRDGVRYRTTTDENIAPGVATVPVIADSLGQVGVMDAGQELTFSSPIAGVNATATVAAPGIAGGVDGESEAAFCSRILAVLRSPASGGTPNDYVRWAKQVPGVTRVWPTENWDGLGSVRVLFVMDGRPDNIPEAGDVTVVANWIEAQRPCCAEVTVAGPVPDPLDFDIDLSPNTPEAQAAVEAALRDLITRESEPGGTLKITHIGEAISGAAGETDHVLNSPTANVVAAAGEITTFGAITW